MLLRDLREILRSSLWKSWRKTFLLIYSHFLFNFYVITKSYLGLSRRIRFKVKFTRKFGEDVYGFLSKSKLTRERFLTRIVTSMLNSETFNIQKKVVNMVRNTSGISGLEMFFKLFLIFKLELFFLLISKRVQFEYRKNYLNLLKNLKKTTIDLNFAANRLEDKTLFKPSSSSCSFQVKFCKILGMFCTKLFLWIRFSISIRKFLVRHILITQVFGRLNIQNIFYWKKLVSRIRKSSHIHHKRCYRLKKKSSARKTKLARTLSVLKGVDLVNMFHYKRFPILWFQFPLFSKKDANRIFSLSPKVFKMKKRWQSSLLTCLFNSEENRLLKRCHYWLSMLNDKIKQQSLCKNFRIITKKKIPFFLQASVRQMICEKARLFGIGNRFNSYPVMSGKFFCFLNLKRNNFIFFEQSCMSFSKRYANYFLFDQSEVRKSRWLSEAREISNFFIFLLKFLLNYPFVREKFLQEYSKLWSSMLGCFSTSFRSLVQHFSVVQGVENQSTKTKNIGLSFFQFFDRSRELFLQKKAPRLFNFFLTRLEKQYGFFQRDVPFRLDIPLPKTRYKQETEKLMLYRLLKITRRFLGNLTQKRIWNIRKISGLKNFGYAFFNALLLFESRLDIFLVRAHFCINTYEARGLIQNGVVLVNGRKVLNYNYCVSLQDIISIFPSFRCQFKTYLLSKMFFTLEEINTIYNKIFPSYLEINFLKLTVGYIPRLFKLERIPSFLDVSKFLLLNWGKFSY